MRTGTPVSARAAAARREGNLSNADSDARAEATAAVEDLQQRLEKEEKLSEQYKKQLDVLQSKLDDSVKDSAKYEEKVHEYEEQLEALNNEKREATRQIREMETIYEAERSSILKEKEEMANKEEEMQTIIQRLKDSLAQRTNGDEDGRPSRQGMFLHLETRSYTNIFDSECITLAGRQLCPSLVSPTKRLTKQLEIDSPERQIDRVITT